MGVGTLATGTLTRTACKRWVLWLWGELVEIIGARGLPDGDNVGGATTCIKTDIVLQLIDKKVKSESHNKIGGPCFHQISGRPVKIVCNNQYGFF